VIDIFLFVLGFCVLMAALDIGLYALFLFVIEPALNRWLP